MRDRLGEVFKAIVMTACVICGIGAVFSVFGASPNIKAEDWIRGGIFLALCIGCLFAFWLVSTLSKIAVKMSETEAHLKDAVILLSNISKKLNPPKAGGCRRSPCSRRNLRAITNPPPNGRHIRGSQAERRAYCAS